MKIINLYGGPGIGKSTTAVGLFHLMKKNHLRCEYIAEWCKDSVYEGNLSILKYQEYLFVQQLFKLRRLEGQVDYVVSDSPLLQYLTYIPEDFDLPSLPKLIHEAHEIYDSLDILLERTVSYQAYGRYQNEQEAIELDNQTIELLKKHDVKYTTMKVSEHICEQIFNLI